MKTKEAIDWVEQYRYAIHSKTDGVIELLERGEKFEEMKIVKGMELEKEKTNLEKNINVLLYNYLCLGKSETEEMTQKIINLMYNLN